MNMMESSSRYEKWEVEKSLMCENVDFTLDGVGKNNVPSYRTKNKFNLRRKLRVGR